MASFLFTLASVVIQNTRSKHKDTDYIVFTMKVGASAPQTQVKYLGDDNSGTFPINLTFADVELEPGNHFVFNYMIVNAGSAKAAEVEAALQRTAAAWANGQGPIAANLTGALQDGQTWFNVELQTILNPNSCDGMVAAEQNHLTYEQLISMLGGTIFNQHTHHPGVHSPSGCGPNSQYTVNYEIWQNFPLQ
jgi:hypothetical protein